MNKKKLQEFDCPIRNAMEVIQGKWTFSIVFLLMREGTMRYSQLAKLIDIISPRVLSKELLDLVENDIIKRKIYPTVPPTVEYSLTEKGKDLHEISIALSKWGKKYSQKNSSVDSHAYSRQNQYNLENDAQYANE